MQPFQEYILVIGAFQGLLLSMLLITDRRMSGASKLLGVLCLLFALFSCHPILIASGPDNPAFWLLGWIFYLPASIGGLGYLYCRNSILAEKFSAQQLFHFIPLLVCYLLVLDYIVFSPDKLASWINGDGYSSLRLVISEYVMFAQAFFYIPLTLRLISRYHRLAGQKFANFHPNTFHWLGLFMVLMLAVWTLKSVFAFSNYVPAAIDYASDIMIVILIYTIAAAQWRHPLLFTIQSQGEDQLGTDLSLGNAAKSSGILDPSTRAELLASVKNEVETAELFRDSALTLSRLASATGSKTHHLSEALNQQAGQNFYQFINSYRVEYVCAKLREDNTSRVLDIALSAGFSSKSTFNSIFKQFQGVTPTEYRKALNFRD